MVWLLCSQDTINILAHVKRNTLQSVGISTFCDQNFSSGDLDGHFVRLRLLILDMVPKIFQLEKTPGKKYLLNTSKNGENMPEMVHFGAILAENRPKKHDNTSENCF